MALGKTVSELEESLSDAELREWVAFYEKHPFGPDTAWLQTGTIAATVVNVARGFAGKSGGKTISPVDFIPKFGAKPKKGFRAEFFNMFGGRIRGSEIPDKGGA